jgi:hypothetical protein
MISYIPHADELAGRVLLELLLKRPSGRPRVTPVMIGATPHSTPAYVQIFSA